MRHRIADVGVVIARREAHVDGIAERPEPGRGRGLFGGQADVEDVAGHGDVIGPMPQDVADEAAQQIHVMGAIAAAAPIDIAEAALAHQLDERGFRQRADMRVREMGEGEGHWYDRLSRDAGALWAREVLTPRLALASASALHRLPGSILREMNSNSRIVCWL